MTKAIITILTLLILVIITSITSWVIINGIIGHINSIPLATRLGYEVPPFDNYFGVVSFFLSLTFVVYYFLLFIVNKYSNTKATKIFVGIISGLIPITILFLFTYGLPYSNLGSQVYFLNHAIAGGFIPIVENKIKEYFEKNK